MGAMAERAQISITGVVQGVGFRPYVHHLAEQLGLAGSVSNTASGVLIDAEGERLEEFLDRLPREAPPLARIAGLTVTRLPVQGASAFSIVASADAAGAFTLLPPDVSLCPDCLRELSDPRDRRYLYPFINCTNCGPRYSIARSVPYDRPNTTMAPFRICPDCDREYHDPKDRRFHAQPNACPKCGPQVEFRVRSAECGVPDAECGMRRAELKGNEALAHCIDTLIQGGIVAVKGLGGFHLACDALNAAAVRTLRERKRRSNKPFAVMCPDLEAVRELCLVSEAEQETLLSAARPIVLLEKREGTALPGAVAPQNRRLGVMLPYTPLHQLLFRYPIDGEGTRGPLFRALVMTSGNLSEEPIVRDNEEAVRKLGSIADAFLLHDRDIFMRVDDSVLRIAECGIRNGGGDVVQNTTSEIHDPKSAIMFVRRSRGYAPEPIQLPGDGPEVLAVGADLKNTFTLTKGPWAVLSQHIGDMENYETLRFFEECLANLKKVYRADPVAIAHDLHPGYLSTKWAKEHSALPLHGIQHHYAHIGSVMAEKGLSGRVIGIALDGTGYGTDGTLWGGEFLAVDIDGFERMGQLACLPLPGGEAAIREPWRSAVSLVQMAAGETAFERLERTGLVARRGGPEVRQVLQVAGSAELSPPASGAGRYFDAIASLLGLCDSNTFEGEAAMALESLVLPSEERSYPVEYAVRNGYTVVDLAPLVREALADLEAGRDRSLIATRFHNAFGDIIAAMASRMAERTGIRDVALSGGAFQNRCLTERAVRLLQEAGFAVHLNSRVPPNDACISLGQAYIIRERLKKQ